MGNLGCALLVAQPLSSLSHLGRRAEIEERSFARCRGLRMTNRRENTAKTLRCALCSLGTATLFAALFLFAISTNHASRVAAARLQDAIFAAAVASLCVLVLTVPPARVFCRRHSRTGLPYSRNRPREPRPGIS